MVSMTGNAIREIDGDAATVWAEAIKLQWLKGWDNILVTDSPVPEGQFLLIEDRHRVKCRWTRVETHHALEWLSDTGEAGRLILQAEGQHTKVTYKAVYVAKAAADRAFAGFLKVVAGSKVQQESDKDAYQELGNLMSRITRRLSGNPVDDNAGRQMLELCEFGSGTLDPAVVPLLDDDGRLLLDEGEDLVWTGKATTAAAEDAKAAGGHEQFRTLWQSPEPATITLTTQRLIYDIRKFSHADGSWIIIGGVTGAALVGASALRARAKRSGRTMAGQIQHLHLTNLITGADARPTFSGPSTVTATMLQLPDRLLRVSLAVAGGPERALELARLWTSAASADRIARFPQFADGQADKWEAIMAQHKTPTSTHGFHGDFWAIPLGCALTRDQPYGLP